jgi:hypothetical protein
MDKETEKILHQGEKLSHLVQSQEWKEALTRLEQLISSQLTILTLPQLSPEQLTIEVEARRKAANLVNEWVEQVIGTADAHLMNTKVAQNQIKNEGIRRLGDHEEE